MRLAAAGSSLAAEEQRAVKWNKVGAGGLGVGRRLQSKKAVGEERAEVAEM